MKIDIDDRRKRIQERKIALEALKDKQDTEMLVIEDEQMILEDKEEMNELKTKKIPIRRPKKEIRGKEKNGK